MPTRKHGPIHGDQLRWTNYADFIKLRGTVEDSIGLQSNLVAHVINLSKKSFTKDVYKLLNKNLNFVPTKKKMAKKHSINNLIIWFLHTHKTLAYCKDTANHQQHLIKDEIFKKPSGNSSIPPKNHHTVERFIKATNNDIYAELKKLKWPKYWPFLKGNKKHQKN